MRAQNLCIPPSRASGDDDGNNDDDEEESCIGISAAATAAEVEVDVEVEVEMEAEVDVVVSAVIACSSLRTASKYISEKEQAVTQPKKAVLRMGTIKK